jgi:hypothetical protein
MSATQLDLFDALPDAATPLLLVKPTNSKQPGQRGQVRPARRPRRAAAGVSDPLWATSFMVLPAEWEQAEREFGHLIGGTNASTTQDV